MTQTSQQKIRPSPGEILSRAAAPFLIFTAVLAFMLAVSSVIVLPRLTKVRIGGTLHNTIELSRHVKSIEAAVIDLENTRAEYVTPMRRGLYGEAKKSLKYSVPALFALQENIYEIIRDTVPENLSAIVLFGYVYNPDERVLVLEGDVRSVGPRSMTVLAQFVDTIKRAKWVDSVEPPKFARLKNAEAGYHSPFKFTIHIK